MELPLKAFLLFSIVPATLFAQPAEPLPLFADDEVVIRLDELASMPWVVKSPMTADTVALNVHGFPATYIPAWSEAVYQGRLEKIDAQTPFDLVYNKSVQSYIDLYATRKREMTSRMLGLSDLYFPVFEEYLDRAGMPLELKYLAVVESALNPSARSRAGAVGLWQFMLPTGKMFGLDVTSYVDERHDVYKSTEAACKYLKYLYGLYGNWELALAAYNCGPGNVNKAIRRSGGQKDYWKIYDHLPRETRGYVPAFIAVNYIFAHSADHNMYPVAPTYCMHEVDTIQVCYPLDLAGLARLTGASPQEVLELNPTFKLGVVPPVKNPVTVYLPKAAVGVFVNNEDSLKLALAENKAVAPEKRVGGEEVAAMATEHRTISTPKMHTVRRGESLGTIAQKYNTSVTAIKNMNGIRGTMIRAGQRLQVGTTTRTVAAQVSPTKTALSEAYFYYEVQPGDTLINIAQRYPGVSVEDLRRLNGDLGADELKPGSKIKVSTDKG